MKSSDHIDPQELEAAVDEAIAACDGDPRAAVRALILANSYLEYELAMTRPAVSYGFSRGWHARRREIWTELNTGKLGGKSFPTQPATVHKDRPQNQKQFAAELSQVTGKSKRDVNMKLRRVDELGGDLRKIAGTSLDKGVEMDALISLPQPERSAPSIDRPSTKPP